MLCVKTSVKPSGIHGFGVFAEENIKKGDLVWKFHRLIDSVIDDNDLKTFSDDYQKYIKHYSYKTDGKYVFCGDNGKYVNHSDSPNIGGLESEDGFGVNVASKDIKIGEEITCDYTQTDDDYELKLK